MLFRWFVIRILSKLKWMVYYWNRIHDKNFKPFDAMEEEEDEEEEKNSSKQDRMYHYRFIVISRTAKDMLREQVLSYNLLLLTKI